MGLYKRFLWITALSLGFGLPAVAQTTELPISVFIDAQPIGAFEGWTDTATFKNLIFDAYGKRTALFGLDFGTTFSGTITMTDLGTGRTRVRVVLHTSHAVCWAYQFAEGWTAPQLAFGTAPFYLAQGEGPAAFGNSDERIAFTIPTGSPFPSMDAVFGDPANALESDVVTINCDGVLRPGSGYPDGMPGKARTTQTGLMNTGAPTGCPGGDGDCWPVERVAWWPTGGGD
jgi:hypothetical protein